MIKYAEEVFFLLRQLRAVRFLMFNTRILLKPFHNFVFLRCIFCHNIIFRRHSTPKGRSSPSNVSMKTMSRPSNLDRRFVARARASTNTSFKVRKLIVTERGPSGYNRTWHGRPSVGCQSTPELDHANIPCKLSLTDRYRNTERAENFPRASSAAAWKVTESHVLFLRNKNRSPILLFYFLTRECSSFFFFSSSQHKG